MREIEFKGFCEGYNDNKCFEISLLALKECGWSCDKGIGISIPYQPHVKIMQYTGLKDKNGKKIFEGDIVKNILILNNNTFEPNIDVVEFNEEECSFMLGKNKRHFNKSLDLEVIGNIYEDNNEKDR